MNPYFTKLQFTHISPGLAFPAGGNISVANYPLEGAVRIAIVGTGRMAENLGKAFMAAGHFVAFGSRTPEKQNPFHQRVGLDTRIYGHEGAITAGEVVILAVPYSEVHNVAARHAGILGDKVVIDITNPFAAQPADGRAGAELTAEVIGNGARVVAAFKDNFAATFSAPGDQQGSRRQVHFATDDEEARSTITALAESIGFEPVDCGPLHNAVALDHLVPLMIDMDRRLNDGKADSIWRYVRS